ncbi:MAG: hypothetical protein HY718_19005 [Planctomycetes bacterium]|nr:hypothetical protein [Planctomycetota bacterium]
MRPTLRYDRRHQLTGTAMLAVLTAAGLAGGSGCQQTQSSASQAWGSARTNAGGGNKNRPNPEQPTPEEVARMIEPNVLGVKCFYDPRNPWIWNIEHTQVRGVRIGALYLLGPKSTGVFGDGVIHPRLFVAYHDEQGKLQYKLVKEWTLDVQQAMPFRAKRRSDGGWGYSLFLPWGDLNLAGREIRLTVSFERTDGIVISGSKKDFRVPRPDSQG